MSELKSLTDEQREKARERNRRYYERNREQVRERKRLFRENNPEKVREWQRRYQEKNAEKRLESGRRYYRENREERSEYSRRYREENREKVLEGQREYRRRDREENPLRSIWSGMKRRCLTPTTRTYPSYGGRGITVYGPWVESYDAFAAWIVENLGERPSPEHSLDRIDVDGDYEPGNLRWADRKTQRNNQRKKVFVGDVLSLIEDGLTTEALRDRLLELVA